MLLMEHSLALITSQEQRIKELTEENERVKARILAENHLRTQAEEMLANGMNVIKADTVRKMQERLTMRFGTYTAKDMTPITEVFRLLDQIAKEMLEGG